MIRSSVFLRRALLADALVSGAMALLLTCAATPLAKMLSLPIALLFEAGLFLIAYAGFVGWLGTREVAPRLLVLSIIVGNAAWTLGSLALIAIGPVAPNVLGSLFVAGQAIVVGIFAELQFIGLRKSEGSIAA